MLKHVDSLFWPLVFGVAFVFPGVLLVCVGVLTAEEDVVYCLQCRRATLVSLMHDQHRCVLCQKRNAESHVRYPFTLDRNLTTWQ